MIIALYLGILLVVALVVTLAGLLWDDYQTFNARWETK